MLGSEQPQNSRIGKPASEIPILVADLSLHYILKQVANV